jgi:hypothetical protein
LELLSIKWGEVKMKGLSITNLIIMLIVGISVMIGLGNFYIRNLNAYGVTPSGSSASSFSLFNNTMFGLTNSVGNIQNKTAGVLSGQVTILTGIYDITSIFLSVGQVIFQIPTVMGSFINTMISILSMNAVTVPSWLGTMIAIIIIVIVTFQVLRIFTKSFFEI